MWFICEVVVLLCGSSLWFIPVVHLPAEIGETSKRLRFELGRLSLAIYFCNLLRFVKRLSVIVRTIVWKPEPDIPPFSWRIATVLSSFTQLSGFCQTLFSEVVSQRNRFTAESFHSEIASKRNHFTAKSRRVKQFRQIKLAWACSSRTSMKPNWNLITRTLLEPHSNLFSHPWPALSCIDRLARFEQFQWFRCSASLVEHRVEHRFKQQNCKLANSRSHRRRAQWSGRKAVGMRTVSYEDRTMLICKHHFPTN